MSLPAVPDASRREHLLAVLAGFLATDAGPFLAEPVAPAGAAFPERWRATRTGLMLVLRRLAWHAGLEQDIRLEGELMAAPPTERRPATRVEMVRVSPRELALELGFIGRDDVAGTLAHEIGVAYAALHRPAADGPYRATDAERGAAGIDIDDADLERGAVAAVYLGLGVLAANAAYQQYSTSGRTNGAYMPLEYDVLRSGYLTMSELAFLLAVQAVARGGTAAPAGLSAPQHDEVSAWVEALLDPETVDDALESDDADAADPAPTASASSASATSPSATSASAISPSASSNAASSTVSTAVSPSASIRASITERVRRRLGISTVAPRAAREIIAFDDPGEPTDGDASRTAFRWRTHRAGSGFLAGSVLGVVLVVLVPMRGLVPFGAAAISIVSGFVAGRRIRVARCSRCLALVGDRGSCPRCNAVLRGDIAHLNDRLAAEEALEHDRSEM